MNTKVISDINQFRIGVTNYYPVEGQFLNPHIHWYFLLDSNNERIRCFKNDEVERVIEFLNNSKIGINREDCFINIQDSPCDNSSCEDEVADSVVNNQPNRIIIHDFGINGISEYDLEFKIIGYFINV